jgi:hypothetical protein
MLCYGHYQHVLHRHISHTTNVFLYKFRCSIFIGVRIIKEMPGSVASGTLCIYNTFVQSKFVPVDAMDPYG